jgi:hypothetical protein
MPEPRDPTPKELVREYGLRSAVREYGLWWVLRAYALRILVALLAVGWVIVIIALVTGRSTSHAGNPLQGYGAPADAVPTNRVAGSGTVTVQLRGHTATITVTTEGLLNGSPHLMHIHAEGRGECPPASAARRHNGNLSISTGDGVPYYGPPLVSLTEWGSTIGSAPNNIDFDRYPAGGAIHYTRTITMAPVVADLIRDGNGVFVLHGIDYNHNGIYDFGALGVSDLDQMFPGEATAPALCGALRAQSPTARSEGGARADTYVASLHLTYVTESTRPLFRFRSFRLKGA